MILSATTVVRKYCGDVDFAVLLSDRPCIGKVPTMLPDPLLAIVRIFVDFAIYLWLCAKPSTSLAAENLFLRKQLAL